MIDLIYDKGVSINTPQSNVSIYCWENLINQKKYVGQTKQGKKRLSDEKSLHNVSGAFQEALIKYGQINFKCYILEYCSIDELKQTIPNVLDKDIYRIAGMLPGEREFLGIPPMYYVSTNGKNFDVARKSYREFAHMRYEIFCKAYKNIVGHAFSYSLTCKPAYKVVIK